MPKRYSCAECEEKFVSRMALDQHIKSHEPDEALQGNGRVTRSQSANGGCSRLQPETSLTGSTCHSCCITLDSYLAYDDHIRSKHWNQDDIKIDLKLVESSAEEKNDQEDDQGSSFHGTSQSSSSSDEDAAVASQSKASSKKRGGGCEETVGPTEAGPCSNCGRICSSNLAFSNHLKSCFVKFEDAEPHRDSRCCQCDEIFNSRGSLASHKKLFHPLSRRAARTCGACGLTFDGAKEFSPHLQQCVFDYLVDNASETFKCLHCNEKFASRGSRDKHTRNFHSARATVKCARCDKSFKGGRALGNHMRAHDDHEENTDEDLDC